MARTTKRQTATPPIGLNKNTAGNGINEGDIARRAYELFLKRNGEHGHDMEDWLRAERELRKDALAN